MAKLCTLPIFLLISSYLIHRLKADCSISKLRNRRRQPPTPQQVTAFIKDRTTIDKIELFDANPDILRAFVGSGVSVIVTVANAGIWSLAKLLATQTWVATNIFPFYRQTKITRVAVGNEILATGNEILAAYLLPTHFRYSV
ncbi:hypothetical protein RJ640_018009 [Escallonia rubra]|uniref:Glucan endo-1,3-beta-D-glucosidase n=1 Tax=Escallonia rubra TaxID=112253 RepID=A0AA88RL13_9ASTE|nr:hypothetical protein RJ640_018009 [Escallonia rubra]